MPGRRAFHSPGVRSWVGGILRQLLFLGSVQSETPTSRPGIRREKGERHVNKESADRAVDQCIPAERKLQGPTRVVLDVSSLRGGH